MNSFKKKSYSIYAQYVSENASDGTVNTKSGHCGHRRWGCLVRVSPLLLDILVLRKPFSDRKCYADSKSV